MTHIMRDHPYHVWPMLGGMFGIYMARNRTLSDHIFKILSNVSFIYNKGSVKNNYDQDQQFLCMFQLRID